TVRAPLFETNTPPPPALMARVLTAVPSGAASAPTALALWTARAEAEMGAPPAPVMAPVTVRATVPAPAWSGPFTARSPPGTGGGDAAPAAGRAGHAQQRAEAERAGRGDADGAGDVARQGGDGVGVGEGEGPGAPQAQPAGADDGAAVLRHSRGIQVHDRARGG